jgi:hypothetical protein
MKNKVRWMLMLIVVVALVAPNVQAWDLDSGLRFNMDFENTDNTKPIRITTDSEAGLIGGVYDYNTGTPDCCAIFELTGKIGKDANFAQRFDVGTGAIGDCRIVVPNSVPGIYPFEGGNRILATLGAPSLKRTWTMWFNPMKAPSAGTFLRHAYYNSGTAPDAWWEIRIYGGKVQFSQKNDYLGNNSSLEFQTVQSVTDLSIDVNEWHHLAVVIDRTVKENSKIYVDGLEAPVTYSAYNGTADANIDPLHKSPLLIGKGQAQFDGRLDEIRLYHRALSSVEASILNQSDGSVNPIALRPIPRSTNVSIVTDVN